MMNVLSLMTIFLILSSGGVFCSVLWKKKFEEILPITCSVIILILFFFGLTDALYTGVIAVCILAVGLYLVAGVYLIQCKDFKTVRKNLFTPCFVIYIVIFAVIIYRDYGKLANEWDEFTHWADIVKVMTAIDDFGTNPISNSMYSSYPPGMALLQYMVQKVNIMVTGEGFCEWLLYVAHSIFIISYLIPFIKNIDFKKPLQLVSSCLLVFASPILFYGNIYHLTYIDPVLGILTGAGFATVLLSEKRDIIYSLNVLLICSMLVLAKDAGLLFACFLAAAYVADILFIQNEIDIKMSYFKKLILAGGAIVLILLPKLLWEHELLVNAVRRPFTNPYDFSKLLEVILGRDQSYRATVWENFVTRWYRKQLPLGRYTIVEVSFGYAILFVLLLLAMYTAGKYVSSKKGQAETRSCVLTIVMFLMGIVYIVGMAASYMFKFAEHEALELASFDRYINMMYLALWMVVVLEVVTILLEYVVARRISIIILCIVVYITPIDSVKESLMRAPVKNSIEQRAEYAELIEKIEKYTEEDAKIYLIVQEKRGLEALELRYCIRPRWGSGGSIGEAFYEGDIYTANIDAKQWQSQLINEYDYVALYQINDYFLEHFGVLFTEESNIAPNNVYKINKDIGLLEQCK